MRRADKACAAAQRIHVHAPEILAFFIGGGPGSRALEIAADALNADREGGRRTIGHGHFSFYHERINFGRDRLNREYKARDIQKAHDGESTTERLGGDHKSSSDF